MINILNTSLKFILKSILAQELQSRGPNLQGAGRGRRKSGTPAAPGWFIFSIRGVTENVWPSYRDTDP